MAYATGPHLCPMLVVHGEAKLALTPFSLMPTSLAEGAYAGLRLASVPFHLFRFYPPSNPGDPTTYPLDLSFLVDGWPPYYAVAANARPVVLWTSQQRAESVVQEILERGPVLLLVVTESKQIQERIERLESQVPLGTVLVSADSGAVLADAPQRIWAAYLELLRGLMELAGGSWPDLTAPPEVRVGLPFQRYIEAAAAGAFSPFLTSAPPIVVPEDYVVAPTRIVLAHQRSQIARWSENHLEREEAQLAAVQEAQQVCRTRGFTNFLLIWSNAHGHGQAEEFWADMRQVLGEEPVEAARRALGTEPDLASSALVDLALDLPPGFERLCPPQVILVSPSTTLLPSSARRLLGLIDDEADPLQRLERECPDYHAALIEALRAQGRRLVLPEPSTPLQKEVLAGLVQAVRGESRAHSMMATFYATRFSCPVLKTDRLGDKFLAPFDAVREAVARVESAGGNPSLRASVEAAVAAAVRSLSEACTAYLPEAYRSWIDSHGEPLVHAFADWPIEFVLSGCDSLGYRAQVSRTPLTPGDVMLTNYTRTEHTLRLPTRPEEFVFVTPFEDDEDLRGLVENPGEDIPGKFSRGIVRRKSDLLRHLKDPNVGCLVYFGHGYHDPDSDETALVLQEQYLRAADIRALTRVPPLVVLIGCDTAAAGIHLGGIQTALFRAGAQLVVGTSFPVPRSVGILFLLNFVRNYLSPGQTMPDGRVKPYRDMAEIVTVVRRRMRVFSDLYSLFLGGHVTAEEFSQANTYLMDRAREIGQHPDFDEQLFESWREYLTAKGLIERDDAPATWPVVPYALMFTLLGFPWTTRNENW